LRVSNGKTVEIPSKGTIQVKAGDMVRVESPGGGGYGDPLQRRQELVLQDVIEGKVSAARAERYYNLASNPAPSSIL
jgi:N-methylhydantoinase B